MNTWLSKNNQHAIFMDGRKAYTFAVNNPEKVEKYKDGHAHTGMTVGKWVQARIDKFDALPITYDGKPFDPEVASFEVVDFGDTHTITIMHPVPGEILTFQAVVNGKSAVVQFYVHNLRRGKKWIPKLSMRVRLVNEDGLPSFLILEH